MAVKLGNVIKNKHGLHVITHISSGVVIDTEKLEDYISKNAVVKSDGDWITIESLIQEQCDKYLRSGVEIIIESH